jgi:HEAT repeat protein/nucleoside phosphorylase
LGDRRAVDPLCAALKDQDGKVRGSVATALGALGDRRAVDPLCAALKDQEGKVRSSAATALGALGDRGAVDPLCAALKDQDDKVRSSAATALGALGDAGAVEALTAALRGRERNQVACAVAESLRRMAARGSEAALAALADVAEGHPAPEVRTTAVMTLVEREALNEAQVQALIAPAVPRRDGRPRDTDRGVQGQAAAGVIQGYRRAPASSANLQALCSWLNDPSVHSEALNPVMIALRNLPARAAVSALEDITQHVKVMPDRVASGLVHVRASVSLALAAERDLNNLRSDPSAALRRAFPKDALPWFQRPTMPAAPVALIVTAITLESGTIAAMLKEQLWSMTPLQVAGREVDRFEPLASPTATTIILAQAVEKGPQAMQSLVSALVPALKPICVLMVGVCGGLPEHGAAQNSVVIARQLYNYERRRERKEPRLTPQVYRCDPGVIDRINAAVRRGVLDDVELGGLRGVKLHLKDMASGEGLIDDVGSPERERILALSDDLVGVEMEGHGLYHQMWESALLGPGVIPYAVIKGVSDFCDGQMAADKDARQDAAARRAMRVALAVIPQT